MTIAIESYLNASLFLPPEFCKSATKKLVNIRVDERLVLFPGASYAELNTTVGTPDVPELLTVNTRPRLSKVKA